MIYDTLTEACHAWVNEMNFIPVEVIGKLAEENCEGLTEITPPTPGDRVYVYSNKYDSHHGTICKYDEDTEEYLIEIDGSSKKEWISADEFELVHEGYLPIWGTVFSFKDNIDNDWLSDRFGENGLRKMAECGFRVYEQEDFGYIFGIDSAGYSFYDAHWIPLYKARGLHWHKIDDT